MCGIAGIFAKEIDRAKIETMVNAQEHRGPDARGIYINNQRTVALGHTRLSVIDLSEAANQPMSTTDGRYTIIFNGEIYNFKSLRKDLLSFDQSIKFLSNSDTETILFAYKAWGHEMVTKLEGMFALAIYDQIDNKVFLCRDRLGKKPLFYFNKDNQFIFSSEIKSLMSHPVVAGNKRINNSAFFYLLHLGYIPEPHTVYSAIHKFPAGNYAYVDDQFSVSIFTYWRTDKILNKRKFSNDREAIDELKISLTNAVNKRLISDVPLGTFLSGGTDSSLVTALASKNSMGPLKTFCIGFKDNKYDESIYSRKVATHLETDHHEYILSEKDAVDILETYLKHFDEPFADTSAIPTMLVSHLAKKDVTVALTGDGGDELFLGYGAYDWANRLNNSSFKLFQNSFSFLFRNFGNDRLKRISHLIQKVPQSYLRSHIFSQEQYFFSQSEIQNKLVTHSDNYSGFEYSDPPSLGFSQGEMQSIFDINYYLKDDLLVKVDRASMYYALECRCPLLDHHVVELALSIPHNLKKRNKTSKWILKEILKDYLPDSLINRPKRGFSIPLVKWMKNDLQYLVNDYLNRSIIENTGIVNSGYVEELKKSFFKGNNYLYNRLWILIVMHKWIKENG